MIKIPLLHLLNLSQCRGEFPEIFKLTKLIPVAKTGKDPTQASSYRPVSNLSIVGKLLESAVLDQLDEHITLNNLINKDQHGGRTGHSTTTCLGELLEDIKEASDHNMKVAITAIDLSAA